MSSENGTSRPWEHDSALDSVELQEYLGDPGSQLGPVQHFSNKSGRKVKAQRAIADFRRLLPLGADSGLVPGVSDRDLLHAVVGLYDTSLFEMTPDVLYSTICEKWARTILVIRDMSETLEYLEERKQKKKGAGGDGSGGEVEVETDNADTKDEDVLPPQQVEPSFFREVYSDTESEDEDEDESSEEDFSKGVHKYINEVKERRQRLLKHPGKLDQSHVGIEHRLLACMTYEKKFIKRDRVIHLTLLTVRRRFRKYGIGKYLLSELFDPTVVGQYDAIVVHADNEAVEFFQKFGFSDDIVLNSRWSELAEQFTNCSLMCYLPGFSGHGLLSMPSLPGTALFEIEQEIKKWKEKNLEASQAQVSCMMRLKHELMQLTHQTTNQRAMLQRLLDENTQLQREKRKIGPARQQAESDEEFEEQLVPHLEQRLKCLEASLKTQLSLSWEHALSRAGERSGLAFPHIKVRSQQEPYDHTQDAANFYDISEQFKTSMKSDPTVRDSFQVTMITKAVPKDTLKERHRRALQELADPAMVASLYYCGSLASQARVESILSDGFSQEDFTDGEYGRGLYFSKYPSRAAQPSAPGKLILACVGLGKVQTVTSKDASRQSPSPGFDSIIVAGKRQPGEAPSSPHTWLNLEYVVFNPSQALPVCLVSFQLAEAKH